MTQVVEGHIVDIEHRTIFEGAVHIAQGKIVEIEHKSTSAKGYILPGFIDAHVHIESSMLTPSNFGRLVCAQGTVAIVTDPHEIANVMGVKGINFMLEQSKEAPIKMFFSIPSCVPSTPFDVAGDTVTSADIEQLAASGRFVALSEMMNVPGVLYKDSEVMAKLHTARKYHLPVDGHSPKLGGKDLDTYIGYGISTDHECFELPDAEEKIAKGMAILIREGSAARNYEILKPLIGKYPDKVMFCTDDAHPDDIIERGHIDKIVRRAVADGFDLFDVLRIASINPINHYKLDVGQLRVADKADFIIVDNLQDFDTLKMYINGQQTYSSENNGLGTEENGLPAVDFNHFEHDKIEPSQLAKAVETPTTAIEIVQNELVTKPYLYTPEQPTSHFESDSKHDIAKIVYINRYNNGLPQIALCKGFGLKRGAFASTVAHDTHNIIAAGCNDQDLAAAINALIAHKGGLSVCDGNNTRILPLPVGGIMSNRSGHEVAALYQELNQMLRTMHCRLSAPFMTLSFMSLVVIPEIKIGEKGLFSYSKFDWITE